MGVYNIFSRENLSNHNPPSAATMKAILQDMATPVFEKMGIHATKNPYLWMSDFNKEGVRKIIQFSRHKGLSSDFRIGTNFKFMPVVNTKQKIVYKKDNCHLFTYGQTIIGSRKGISLWNEKSFVRLLNKSLHKRAHKIEKYVSNMTTLEQNILIAEQQLRNLDKDYFLHYPDVAYVLSFLYANVDKKEKATQLMEQHLKEVADIPREILHYLEKL